MVDSDTSEVSQYIARLEFPVTKEELINGLLTDHAPGHEVALVERLPGRTYDEADEVLRDLEEITRLHSSEVAGAETYDDYLELVIRHVGDIAHTNKEAYNRVVSAVIRAAVLQHALSEDKAREMARRLEGGFGNLRGSMSEVTDDSAPLDPREDLPTLKE